MSITEAQARRALRHADIRWDRGARPAALGGSRMAATGPSTSSSARTTGTPQASRASIETVSWLRLIGYNALSAWRTLAPRKDGKPLAWARAAETLRDALLVAQVTELTAAVT